MVCATHTLQHQLSLPHKHSSATHAACVPHTQSRPRQGLLTHTQGVMSCDSHTPSLPHTHSAYVTFPHPRTRSVICLQEPLDPHLSPGLRHTRRTLSLSTSPRDPAAPSTSTHKQPIIPYPSHTQTVIALPTDCLPRTSCVSHTYCGQPRPHPHLKHSLLPTLWGLQPGGQTKIPHLQFHVLGDKEISWTGVERCVRLLPLCIPTPTPTPTRGPRSLTQLEISVQDASLV